MGMHHSAKGLQKGLEMQACFVAGTLITTADGFKPIEEIEVGDLVLSENEITGEVALKRVAKTFVHESNELIYVHTGGETITTTPTHPFYVDGFGWTLAGNLRAGDVLVLSNGRHVVVEWVQHEILEAPIHVYNFEVEDFHTYFVGECGVLVHNSCRNPYGKKGGPAHQQKTQDIKNNISAKDKSLNHSFDTEKMYDTTGGHKNRRFADVVELDGDGQIVAIYQVGKVNKNGLPVSRESKAIEDIMNSNDYNGAPIYFVPYNPQYGNVNEPIIYM